MHQGNRTGLVVSLVAGMLLLAGCSASADPEGDRVAPLVAQVPADQLEPVETVELECSDETGETVVAFTVERTDRPDFSEIWTSKTTHTCTATDLVEASTDVELAAADALGRPAVHTLYGLCGAANPEAIYVRDPDLAITADSAPTIVAMLELCPDFPYADELQTAVDRAES